jgi:excisionase family DNA binding protein
MGVGFFRTIHELEADSPHIHKSTLYQLIKKHQLPVFRVGSDYRFDRQAIDGWCRAQEAKQHAPRRR